MDNKIKFLAATGLMALTFASAPAKAADEAAKSAEAPKAAEAAKSAEAKTEAKTEAKGEAKAAEAAPAAGGAEKCLGVAKAGKNDCAAADGSHSCKGHSAKDNSAVDWLNVPAGLCEKLAGGKKA